MKGMSTVAEQLRSAREARKLTVEQVAEMTKIRTDHVRALEDGNFSVFSATVYIRGSVKNYGTMLKLDMPSLLGALDAELGKTEQFSEPPPLTDQGPTMVDQFMFVLSKVNMRMAKIAGGLLVFILLIIVANLILKHFHKSHHAPNLPPAVYQPANSGDTIPLPKK